MRIIRSKLVTYIVVALFSINALTLSLSSVADTYGYDPDYLDQDGPNAGDMIADLLVARPLTFVASVVGAGAWILSLPFTLIGGNTGEAGEELVVKPLAYTFVRPLGYMEEGTPPRRHQDPNNAAAENSEPEPEPEPENEYQYPYEY